MVDHNPPPRKQTFCVCGCWIGIHIYNYETEEFGGCPIHSDCPSVETFIQQSDQSNPHQLAADIPQERHGEASKESKNK